MDKHLPGAFSADPRLYACPSWYGEVGQFVTTKFFGMKINKYMHDHGISRETLAKVAAKNYRNGALNPNAFRRKPLSEEEILASPMLNYPLTQYMFCSPDEGAAAVVLCRAEHAHRYTDTPIYLRATTVRTRRLGAFEVHSPWLPIEETSGATVDASRAAYEMAGIGPEDVDVIQLQDTDAGAEVIHLAENGFCADGEQEALVADGALEIGGALPVNTDGGLIANGEPIGASGLRQVHEVVLQLRGRAGDRQVPGQPEGRLHAALRRARHRRRVDPLRLNEVSTWTPATRPSRPSCAARPGSSRASSGRRPSPTSTTRRAAQAARGRGARRGLARAARRRRRRRAARGRGRGRDRRRRARRRGRRRRVRGPGARARSRAARRRATAIDGAVVAFAPDAHRRRGRRRRGHDRRRSTRSTAATAIDAAYVLVPDGDGYRLARVRVDGDAATRRRPHARGARRSRPARRCAPSPISAGCSPPTISPRGPRSASRSRAPTSSVSCAACSTSRSRTRRSAGSTAFPSVRSRPCSTCSPRRAA